MTASPPGQLVDIPLPPDTAETFGYRHDARFVSFRWSYGELIADDGQSSGTANGWVFGSYARHRAVAPLLDPFDLGGSDHPAPSVLLLDRERNRAYIAPAAEAKAFLRDQHPPEPELAPEQQEAFQREFEKLLAEHRSRPVDHGAVAKEMAEQRGRVGRFMSWIDQCPTPPRRGHTP
ncbi:hypothetical protein GobsT_50140 [Gemmata obscuriglobus]|uniref:hypothetical protein n=1 Tax=Gemmata obscuriglobus TaxID=114 RepID=UPI0011CD2C52|nr:hypothetical protein [Gemmata obscuriglobus]QEG30211.1 hypothetical protein GobsT_50140 [Gemmata obscuriglobus]VTS09535.1 Uncharacterized protein OS=Pelobacter propionicus (strain DSM 2379) GN=Ppro_3759 PE=4 SV=1 [Gemmata obscuriglobus UQM 2246]